jgi:hypothetical protein
MGIVVLVCGCSNGLTSVETAAGSADAGAMGPLSLADTGVLGPASHSDAGAVSSLGDASVVAKLHGMALQVSQAAGVSSPATMVAVAASDHQAAQSVVSGAVINDHSPVYVVEMTGGPFTARTSPPGTAAPKGNVLTITVDAVTYRLTDVGFHPVAPNLSQIDPVVVNLLASNSDSSEIR